MYKAMMWQSRHTDQSRADITRTKQMIQISVTRMFTKHERT